TMPNVGIAWNTDMNRAVTWAKISQGYFREHYLRWGEDGGKPVFKAGEWKRDTTLQRRVESSGVPFYAGSYGRPSGEEAEMRYVRFSYLLFKQPVGGGLSWFSEGDPYNGAWTGDLGSALGPATRNKAVWTRSFAKGTIRVDSATGQADLVVKPG